MKILVVGSVAAGTSVAAKARRNTESAEIVIYDRDQDISYSGCGLPYYVGGEVADLDRLRPRDPEWFAKRYNVAIHTGHEVTSVDHETQTVTVRRLADDELITDDYDVLVLATGVSSVVPDLPGVEKTGVFTLRSPRDADALKSYADSEAPSRAVVVGAGYIGLETAEQLVGRGVGVSVVEAQGHAMPRMDPDMSARVDEVLDAHGVDLLTHRRVAAIEGEDRVERVRLADGTVLDAELVVLAVGVRPNTDLARQVGAAIGATGAVVVDRRMQTSVPGIYAVGDVASSFSRITGEPVWIPLGSTANKMGRVAGHVITGGHLEHEGILGTSIVRVFDVAVASTGLTETQARRSGFDVEVLHNIKPDHSDYLGGRQLTIKAVADRATSRLLGAQAIGGQGVDKRIDVLATAITYEATVGDLFHLDLAYAPPFATTKDPVHYTGMALDGAINGHAPLITPAELIRRTDSGERWQVVDVRSAADHAKSRVDGAVNIPLKELRERAGELDPEVRTVTYCNKGVTGNAGQNVLRNLGFEAVYNLFGGNSNYQAFRRAGLG